MLVRTLDFSEASGCPPEKGVRQMEHRRKLLPPPRQGTPQSRKAALITTAVGAQANILSLGLPPGRTPLGFGAGGSEHCLVRRFY